MRYFEGNFWRRWCIRRMTHWRSPFGPAGATLSSTVPAVNTATSSIPSLLKVTENMVHPGGFEPPTARFVAEYSIQLSYGCIGKFILLLILISLLKPYQVRDGASGGFRPPTARFVAEYSIQLSYGCIGKFILLLILIPPLKPYQVRDGASEDSNLRPLGS